LRTYIRKALCGVSTRFQTETLPPEERARETMAMQLRRADGINRGYFAAQTGYLLDALAGVAISRHVELGLLHDDGASVRLTREGQYVADAVITGLL
jgi:coproporphyrinogen III oxidase-like Fe-S oxidoreductase